MSPVWLYMFPHYLINGNIFSNKKVIEHKMCIKCVINVKTSSCKVPAIRHILMKPEFSGQIFEKYPKNKFHEMPYSGSRLVPCGKTEGRTSTTKLIVSFRNFANAPKDCKFSLPAVISCRLSLKLPPERSKSASIVCILAIITEFKAIRCN